MQFDYIIIGSGSAGSTLAYRLGENKKYTILVLEYGGSNAGPLIQMPAAFRLLKKVCFNDKDLI